MKQVEINICVGTTCFIMGASELQDLEEYIPEEKRKYVNIKGTSCLNLCKNDNYGSAPFVTINGEIIGNATIDKILEKIYKIDK